MLSWLKAVPMLSGVRWYLCCCRKAALMLLDKATP